MVHSHNHAKAHVGHLPLETWEARLIGRKLIWDGINYKLADDPAEEIPWPERVRFAGPDHALTCDWVPERLTVYMDEEGVAIRAEYG